ncbi:NADH dehydrogenase [ubiquinone] 1 beta subcomplex subunit 7-like [Myxocyprinus asiaticus]|uniref:NADH dehydrogenase [ubiquinone] 1 beta subcomplex subunit 7-like n=1 Tax=Myxocyprinus asiaticus TaxID=70543 RepID=UPI002222D219|nr:NADH dehydrogenase [ubiquinone] 1 beta subcomplex subunit 7-like [Myxocyprinus asiaticus]
MGAHLARSYITEPDTTPDPKKTSDYDPKLGFTERHERVMVATQEQMNMAMLPVEQRDYCAHHLLKLMKCKRDNFPNFLACKHERHDWDYCQHQDYVMRMKEYERERRLNLRKKRIETQAA